MRPTADLAFPSEWLTRGDRLFQGLAVFAICLEIIVFIEPAPVDVALLLCLGVGLVLGKLVFTAVSKACLISLAIFAVANLVSMYDPFDLNRAVWYVFVTLYLIGSWFLFVGAVGKYGPRFMAALINAYCFAGLISAFLGAGGYFHFLPYTDVLLLAGRARGLFKDCNVYGPYFVPMALFALTRMTSASTAWRSRMIACGFFLAAVVAMLLSFSRACWLNFLVSLVVFFGGQLVIAKRGAEIRRYIRMAAAVVAVGTVSVVLLLDTPAVKRMIAMRVTATGFQKYDEVRFATQSLAWDTAQERPLGLGPGQADLVFGYSTHNMYIRVLSENGWIALFALLAFIGVTMARSVAILRGSRDTWLREVNLVAFACIAGHLVNSLVIDTVHWRHIWFVYALPWAYVPVSRLSRRVRVRQRAVFEYAAPELVEG